FGLAKLLQPAGSTEGAATPARDKTGSVLASLTMTGTILGTASYMSPEQVRDQATDHRTDIFTLGAILYEMLSGRRAFDGPSHADRMSAILNSEPAHIANEIEEAAPSVGAIIAHCIEKAPGDRFQSASDLAFALSLVDSKAAHARRGAGAGAARELLDGVYEADWSPDGRQLAIVREEAGVTRIEFPMGTVLYQTTGWISHARVSPKGNHIAFLDHPYRGDDMGAVSAVD